MWIVQLVLVVGCIAAAFAIGLLVGCSSRPALPSQRPTSAPQVALRSTATFEEPLPSASKQNETTQSVAAVSAPQVRQGGRDRKPGTREVINVGPPPPLADVQTWGYQLQDLDLKRAAASSLDMLVVDYARNGTDRTALKAGEVARLQRRRDSSRRIVLAYLSIGEAESYRFYWRRSWSRHRPDWLLSENPDWEQNYAVCFWRPEWQALLYGSPQSYLDKIIAQGFDGIYLDKCDVFDDLRRRERKAAAIRTDLESDMVELVKRIADYARERRPGFLVVMQNAEALLERVDLRKTLDAVAKEELLFGLDAAEQPNDADDVDWSRQRLDLMRGDDKPAFIVEYLNNPEKVAYAARATEDMGYVLYVSDKNRELDRLRERSRVA